PSTSILEKFGISLECEYRIDVLQKELSLCVNGIYKISQGKTIIASTVVNYEHLRRLPTSSSSSSYSSGMRRGHPLGMGFKLLHQQQQQHNPILLLLLEGVAVEWVVVVVVGWRGHYLDGVDALKERLNKKKLYIFLDYDGTLTPIVSNPGDAKLSSQMAGVLERLSLTHRVSIVTGRSMDTILTFLHSTGDARKRIRFAASHGFDIWGPRDTHYQVGGAYLPQLHKARDELIEGSKKYPHCVVEDNRFSISVHYRNVHPDLHVDVSNLVHGVVAKYPQLRLHYGKMVYEIKLNLSWNKGKAVLWLLNAWGNNNNNNTTG
ncbi:hypothetical protein FOZ63_007440, partial [Perkinsus olseni]